jgi:aspartyl-tRNA(Asn)/glutamyl-tRNA(Gln) amidotransferase subunit C
MAEIDKRSLEHLASLARIRLDASEEDTLVTDLRKILSYFEELASLNTEGVEPMSGGTDLRNSFRDDGASESTNRGKGTENFPESHKGLLKVPPVFE